jgi:hypothetical protein
MYYGEDAETQTNGVVCLGSMVVLSGFWDGIGKFIGKAVI